MVPFGALTAVRSSGFWLKRASCLHYFARDAYSPRNSRYQLRYFSQINGADLLHVRGAWPGGGTGPTTPGVITYRPGAVSRLVTCRPAVLGYGNRPDAHWGNHRMVTELGIASYRSTNWH